MDSHRHRLYPACETLSMHSVLQFQGAAFRLMLGMLQTTRSSPGCEPLSRERGAVTHYMADLGMWVRQDRRQRGIAEAVLHALRAECRGLRVPHFSTPFTGAASQRIAAKCGFKVSRVPCTRRPTSQSVPGLASTATNK